MTDRPIIFSAPMVQALLAGRKTQTRRLAEREVELSPGGLIAHRPSPWQKVQVGDRLWVRESCRADEQPSTGFDVVRFRANGAVTLIDNTEKAARAWHDLLSYRSGSGQWVPSIHMPRWASRLTLTVTAARVEKLHAISEDDCRAEGAEHRPLRSAGLAPQTCWYFGPHEAIDPKGAYEMLWSALNGAYSWIANPEVVVITFTVERRNIDQ